jgi:N-methylhydantoinase A
MPIRIPVIELVEIGAGGGSIAHVDAMRRIVVGPESAGSEPGPACYGRGGARPAVTDADLAAGKIDARHFAGGAIALDASAAVAALKAEVGAALGLDAEAAAFGVLEIVDENMASAARAHAIEQGKDIAARTIVAFGGAAPLHAARLAEKLRSPRVIVPPGAGVGSAIGFLLAPASFEVVRSLPMRLDDFDAAKVGAMLAELRTEANAVVRAASAAPASETCVAYMRYVGQGHEIAVAASAAATEDSLRKGFEDAYAALYGRTIAGMPIEILSWSLQVAAEAPQRRQATQPSTQRKATSTTRTDVFDAAAGRRLSHAVFERAGLSPGDAVQGPALVVEAQTTTVVTASFDAAVDGAGNLVLTRKSRA